MMQFGFFEQHKHFKGGHREISGNNKRNKDAKKGLDNDMDGGGEGEWVKTP